MINHLPISFSSGVVCRNLCFNCFVVFEVKQGRAGPHWATSTNVTILSMCLAAALLSNSNNIQTFSGKTDWVFYDTLRIQKWTRSWGPWEEVICNNEINLSPYHPSIRPCLRSTETRLLFLANQNIELVFRWYHTLNGDVSNPRFLPGELFNINPKSMWIIWPLSSNRIFPLWRSLFGLDQYLHNLWFIVYES